MAEHAEYKSADEAPENAFSDAENTSKKILLKTALQKMLFEHEPGGAETESASISEDNK